MKNLFGLWRSDPAEFRRIAAYICAGAWNTLFGLGVYALIYWLFGKKGNYLILSVPANILAVTNAFICYKYIVFKTRGNIVREYLKCWSVYGAAALAGMAELFLLVEFFKLNPVAANICATFANFIFSYFGHKYFSFRKKNGDAP